MKRTTKYVAFDVHQAATVRNDRARVLARSALETSMRLIVVLAFPRAYRRRTYRMPKIRTMCGVSTVTCGARRKRPEPRSLWCGG